jgi:hypothetical protein
VGNWVSKLALIWIQCSLFWGGDRLTVCTVIFIQNLRNTDKINATKHCNCTIADVEHILAKYTWAKEAQKKIAKLKEEGKPLPKSFNEVTLRNLTMLPSHMSYYTLWYYMQNAIRPLWIVIPFDFIIYSTMH